MNQIQLPKMHQPKIDHATAKKMMEAVRKATKPFRIMAICNQLIGPMTKEARKIGWAISRHGSMTRDLDIIAVPWTEDAVSEQVFVDVMCNTVAHTLGAAATIGAGEDGHTPGPKLKPHGRKTWTIHSSSPLLVEDEMGAHPYLDLSIMDNRITL